MGPRRRDREQPTVLVQETSPRPSTPARQPLPRKCLYLIVSLSFSEQHKAGKSSSNVDFLASSELCTRTRCPRETVLVPRLQSSPLSFQQVRCQESSPMGHVDTQLCVQANPLQDSPWPFQGLAKQSIQERQACKGGCVALSTWRIFWKGGSGLIP